LFGRINRGYFENRNSPKIKKSVHKNGLVPKDEIIGLILSLKNHPKIKKAIHKSGKLFIGLTTKPCYELQSRSENNTTILDAFLGQKSDSSLNRSSPILAVWTGLEPATPCVTGMYSNQLNYQTSALLRLQIYYRILFLQGFIEKTFDNFFSYYPKFCFSTKYVVNIFSKLSETPTGTYLILLASQS
jgi:hypothetical protein